MSGGAWVIGVGYGRRVALQKALALLSLPALAQPAPPLRLLALGDSLTAGYGLPRGQGFVPRLQEALRERGRNVRVLDGGVSGDTMAGGAARLDWALAERPQAAIVALGGNDGLRGLPPERMAESLESILARLEARRIPTLLAGMEAPPNLGADYTAAFRRVFADAAARRPALLFLPFFLEGVAGERALNQADGIHPNAAGVAAMVRLVLPHAETLLDRAAAMPQG
jgi:acyl-CoA thioesterase-1